ncbi:MAG: hypothetical protein CVV49_04665 [Spirochaetae bacterium HGW-Spirochaetae-5]|nr:MAG: hypothetical protein CVV49_04665 [Spirochaetae bacterium HGW-Spirochaetae-5]
MYKNFFLTLFMMISINSAVYSSGTVPYIFNLPTCQTAGSGMFNADVGHRYFDVNRHTTNINLALTYGIINPLDITAAYSFKNKDIIGAMKLNILNDYSESDWISLSFYGGGGYKDANQVNNTFSISAADDSNVESITTLGSEDRTSYFGQMIIQKHMFSNRFSLGVVPSYAYNTNFYQIKSKSDYSSGLGFMTEIYFTDSFSICGEVVMNIGGFAFKYMNYNGGLKFAGYRHTFSLWVSNNNGYSPVEYMTGSEGLTPKLSAAFTREFDL